MLFISGILIVGGAVLVIMYNTDLLLRLILTAVGGSPRFAPVMRMAIAYPLSNRFRTGMTIAIFAIVMFSVIFMATMFTVNDIILTDTEQFTGGFDLRVNSSSSNPVDDLPRAISIAAGLAAVRLFRHRLPGQPAGGAQAGGERALVQLTSSRRLTTPT